MQVHFNHHHITTIKKLYVYQMRFIDYLNNNLFLTRINELKKKEKNYNRPRHHKKKISA